MANNYVITIARQFGSLGRLIGKQLAAELNIAYYDRELIEMAAETMGKPVDAIVEYDDKITGAFSKMLYPLGLSSSATQKKLFEIQKSIILDIANKESCVIVGRCADYILQDHPNAMHIFIYASYENRLKYCMEDLHIDSDEAKQLMVGVDKARKLYHKFYTGCEFSGIDGKHLLLDSGQFGKEGSVSLLKEAAKIKFTTLM